ncbi:uncharacterized protein LOC111708179 [Eurytemora carolleeae]|uniref:uncharacterized protein LOC111708179 n=1 Tax=Eurytemora carolleeae TaxID=1294199 RepID=UPI000C7812B2|nr:uncharacterized protein LOC111708179 [Eurytemora carolleeae]|eukprot:XP_023337245.1 uncharacterized protein LOC111708179 [Eurytemora affinis]
MCLTSTVQKKNMDRSRSPAPQISRALYQDFKFIVTDERPTRPSLDEDTKSFSSSSSNSSCISVLSVKSNRRKSSTAHELCRDTKTRKLGSRKPSSQISNQDQENEFSFSQKKSVSSGRPKPRGLSERDRNVFRFSNVSSPKENLNPQIQVPRISVSLDTDDVFLDTLEYPASSRLLLTPSTTYSPRPSSCTSLNLEYSPNIALGIKYIFNMIL